MTRLTPTFVAAGTGSGNSTTSTPTLPAGMSVDDLYLMVVETEPGVTIAVPSGWTRVSGAPVSVGSGVGNGSNGTQLDLLYLWSTGSETAPSIPVPSDHVVSRIAGYTNIDRANPFNIIATATNGTSTTALSWPSVTTTVANCLVLNIVSSGIDTNVSNQVDTYVNANLSSITEQFDNFTTATNGGGFSYVQGLKATAGSVGSTTATLATANPVSYITIALQGAEADPTNSDTGTGTEQSESGTSDGTESDNGTGTESESGTVDTPESDSGTGSESEVVSVPADDTEVGLGTESESVDIQDVHFYRDDFNRDDEPLVVSSSGAIWTSAGTGVLGVVNNQCKLIG